MEITANKQPTGHYEFVVSGRKYRVFRLPGQWSLTEIGLDGLKIAPLYTSAWLKRTWSDVESFVLWRARESGSSISGDTRIVRSS